MKLIGDITFPDETGAAPALVAHSNYTKYKWYQNKWVMVTRPAQTIATDADVEAIEKAEAKRARKLAARRGSR